MGTATRIYRGIRSLADKIIDPLRADEQISHFTLSVPEAQTTTVDSVQGWQLRPPTLLRCPNCDAEIPHHNPLDDIDCPECYRAYDESAYGDLELLAMTCPRCDSEMKYGRRHPQAFDVPEWATCRSCQYHWDLDHWF
ncbi:MAG: hypothetical protein V5A23_01010 [Halobacteriales archaeon]